jgi:methylmalonyl-CoA mutase N-terminal domain/subunit
VVFVEAMTDELERRAYDYFRRIDQFGGMVEAVEQHFCQREIADARFALQTGIDAQRRIVVGVYAYQQVNEEPILMPSLIACARAHAAEGEIMAAGQRVLGSYTEIPVF